MQQPNSIPNHSERQYAYTYGQQAQPLEQQNQPHVIIVQQNPNLIRQYPNAQITGEVDPDQLKGQGEQLVDATFTSRIKFVRKVYILLAIQLMITTGICALSVTTMYPGGFGYFQTRNQWLMYVAIGLQLFLLILIFCVKKIARKVPLNYIMLSLFTLVEAYLLSSICAVASRNGHASWVAISAAMTAGVTIGLTLYAMFTKRDFTKMYGFISAFPFILLILFLSIWVFRFGILSSILNALFALLYCWCLIYDTQLIMGGKRHALELDDYVLGVIILYIDIVGLFLSILGTGTRN